MIKGTLNLLLLLGILSLYSCSEDQGGVDFLGEDNSIVSFTFSQNSEAYSVRVTSDSLIFNVDYGFDFANIEANIKISEGAEITPDPSTISDWSTSVGFTVVSANGQKTRSYTYVAKIAEYANVYDQIVYLRTQADVDAFGAKQYTRVKGIVVNSNEEDPITSLAALNTIEEIEYQLKITGYYGENLMLENLREISTFNVKNDGIKSLSLPKLEMATNFMVGYLNDEFGSLYSTIEDISCPNLKTVHNYFVVSGSFENFLGFSNLEEVGGEILLAGKFTNLKGLEKLTSVNSVTIRGFSLISLEGLQNLTTVKNKFELTLCDYLPSLEWLNLKDVGTLNFNNCVRLKNLNELEHITKLNTLFLSGCMYLEDLEGLRNLKTIKNDLVLINIAHHDYSTRPPTVNGIKHLNGLRGLETIGEDVKIAYCSLLADYSGLSGVTGPLNGTWEVYGNAYNLSKEDFLAGKYTNEVK